MNLDRRSCSRMAVIIWGVALILVAIGLQSIRGHINLLTLAFAHLHSPAT